MGNKSIYIHEECEFCGYPQEVVYSTPFGIYCKNCLILIRDTVSQAIDEVENYMEANND